MSDDDIRTFTTAGGKTLFMRRVQPGRFVRTAPPEPAVAPEDNIILRQLQSIRQENKVLLERQVRDRELFTTFVARVEAALDGIRQDIREVRSEMLSLENKIITGQNEILDIVRRLDAVEEGQEFELFEEEPADGIEDPNAERS